MAYTKTVWQTGDVITAEKLNNMEGGIENANIPLHVFITFNADFSAATLNVTLQEIAFALGATDQVMKPVILPFGYHFGGIHRNIDDEPDGIFIVPAEVNNGSMSWGNPMEFIDQDGVLTWSDK